MDLNGNTQCEEMITPIRKQTSAGMRVRDMIRRYDTAVKTSSDSSFMHMTPSKSSYYGLNANEPCEDDDMNYGNAVTCSHGSSSRSSCESRKTVSNNSKSRRAEVSNEVQAVQLETQKSFMNLSRSREPPQAAPREKRSRHSNSISLQDDEKINIADCSYQSKTTISKTPKGVRIIVDIFFDQNKGIAVEDIVGSRIETDIPQSKILAEFQKRVADSSQY